MAYQSLYRRYRSQNFAEILGQSHVTTALRNAIAEGRHGHAYLFSGPRGTGKTSTARVLAKALNCENLQSGEPCGTCPSCLDIERGKSFDLHELDAASNNKVDDVRELIAKVALGSPGRTKVYILDEVHMLSAGAENALLKTLEEPPEHVVFVLATTEPHKVVETIRSRTQHYEFKLLPAAELEKHVRFVIGDAGLDVDEAGVEYAIRQGGGSARDTLSALDLVAAAGGVPEGTDIGRELSIAIGNGDAAGVIASVQQAIATGREPRTIGEATLRTLRNAFLVSMGAPLHQLSEAAQAEADEVAGALGAAAITRSLETIGQALVEMRQAADPRVPLEVALMRLARREGTDIAALIHRIEALEAEVASLRASGGTSSGPGPAVSTAPPVSPGRAAPPEPDPAPPARATATADDTSSPPAPKPPPAPQAPPKTARPAPAPTPPAPSPPAPQTAVPQGAPVSAETQPTAPTAPQPAAASAPPSGALDLPTLQQAFDSNLLDSVPQRTRTRVKTGRFTGLDGGSATFAVPNAHYVPRVQEVASDVEQAIEQLFGASVAISVVVDDAPPPPPGRSSTPAAPSTAAAPEPPAEVTESEIGPVEELEDATDIAASSVDRITQAFPGAQVVPPPNS